MTIDGLRVEKNVDADPRWLNVIGIGDDGWDGLGVEARSLIAKADLLIGGARHLESLPDCAAERRVWSGGFAKAVAGLAQERGRSVVVLASGDPLLYGVGALIAKQFGRTEMRVIPHLSAFAQVCARMVWPQLDVQLISLCGRPVERLRAALGPRQKIVVLSADATTPATVAAYLCEHGFGTSMLDVFEHLGGPKEVHHEVVAQEVVPDARFADLNTIAISCAAIGSVAPLPSVAGLQDDLFEHDGQMTKQEMRSLTLARLAPRPGELLWDIGLGSGSISIEWLRAARGMRAIGVEKSPERAARAKRNAAMLGVVGLTVMDGAALDVVNSLERPNAVFIGGGLTSEGLLEKCWESLLPGGRLVANTVTLESEALLLAAFSSLGGGLTRVAIERADPVGHMTGWRPAMTVTQYVITKPYGDT